MQVKLIAVLVLVFAGPLAAATVTVGSTEVQYEGISTRQAEAIGRTVSAARKVYVEQFGFDMPEKIGVEVRCDPSQSVMLYTDGVDHAYLFLKSPDQLGRPGPGRHCPHHVFGLCHELGHVAMFIALKDCEWMSVDAGQGWGDYAGAVVVDAVYEAEGEKLWPDPYDYRAEGIARLRKQLAATSPSPTPEIQIAGAFQKLESILGRKGFARLFAAWQLAKVDLGAPEASLREASIKAFPEKKEALAGWWRSVAPVFFREVKPSQFGQQVVPPEKLAGKVVTLRYDDDTSEGRETGAGPCGIAIRFSSPGQGEWYLRSVRICGTRSGSHPGPTSSVDVVLCDRDLKPIATWREPVAAFAGGGLKWVRFEVPPTRVPGEFQVYLNLRSTYRDGLSIGYDSSTRGHSTLAMLGGLTDPHDQGDWMIRVGLDCPKEAEPAGGE